MNSISHGFCIYSKATVTLAPECMFQSPNKNHIYYIKCNPDIFEPLRKTKISSQDREFEKSEGKYCHIQLSEANPSGNWRLLVWVIEVREIRIPFQLNLWYNEKIVSSSYRAFLVDDRDLCSLFSSGEFSLPEQEEVNHRLESTCCHLWRSAWSFQAKFFYQKIHLSSRRFRGITSCSLHAILAISILTISRTRTYFHSNKQLKFARDERLLLLCNYCLEPTNCMPCLVIVMSLVTRSKLLHGWSIDRSIETFRDRKVSTQKEIMFQEKETKKEEGRSTINAEVVVFQHVTGFVYV